jgi:hypothetical protein
VVRESYKTIFKKLAAKQYIVKIYVIFTTDLLYKNEKKWYMAKEKWHICKLAPFGASLAERNLYRCLSEL